jgi:hypothetical protein
MGMFAAAVAMVAVLAAPLAMAGGGVSSDWFDMEKCQICAPMMAEKGLIDHVHWHDHSFATGMVMACSVDPGHEEAFKRSGEKMQAVIARYMNGEEMFVCGHCNSMKELAQAGAKIEDLMAADSYLTVVSATDPRVIEKIHAHAERSNAEMEKMAQK